MDYGWAIARFMHLRDRHNQRVLRNENCVVVPGG